MIARIFPSTRCPVDARVVNAIRQRVAHENVVETQTDIALPAFTHMVPEGVHRLTGMLDADCVGPALCEKALIRRAALGLQPGVPIPRLRG